ncbi:MAG TPA: translation initiation factor IF-2 N-terminal domain-containing protein, partial [Candidatus Acidoferrales bacterium]|nr:translation initiation factor IF-2 N-terminal domain-containing protein [Candidatus Acidoferrales bacterium]
MPESGQIRINELARELEIKAKVLIEYLPEIGIAEKKTHSSSLEQEQADRVRKHFRDLAAAEAAAESEKLAKSAAAKARPAVRPAASVPTIGSHAPASAAPVTAKPVVVLPTIPGVKAPIRPAAASPAGPRTAGAPTIATPAAGHPPAAAPRTAAPSSGTPTSIPSQRPGAPSSQRSPIVTRPAASSPATTGSRPGSPAQGQQRPSGGYSRPGVPARPGGTASVYRPAAGAQGAPRPGGTPTRPAQRPSGRPGQPMGRPTGAAGQAPKAEPGKPLYVRKPPARAKPTIEKRFAEGERKLHPVRARAGAAAGRGIGHAEPAAPPVVREPRPVTITEGITVRELAEKLDIRAKELLKNLLDRGVFAS